MLGYVFENVGEIARVLSLEPLLEVVVLDCCWYIALFALLERCAEALPSPILLQLAGWQDQTCREGTLCE